MTDPIGDRAAAIEEMQSFEHDLVVRRERQSPLMNVVSGEAAPGGPSYEFNTYEEFMTRPFVVPEPLLGTADKAFLSVGSLFMPFGADGSAKSTWTMDAVVHLAAGASWLGIPVPRPVRCCIIENEGPPGLFQRKLRAKVESWEGPDPRPNLFSYAAPWGWFSFADPAARVALTAYCEQREIDLVVANPTLGLGVGASGKPEETSLFVGWLRECGLWVNRAFWLLHHQNKAGQISGDWGRHPDTHVLLERDGNRQRTKLTWGKTRWATLDPGEHSVMLEWVTETWGYRPVALETVGATDDELDARVAAYLGAHPAASTRQVHANVEGTNTRITARLKARFDSVPGSQNAKLWLNRSDARVEGYHDAPTRLGENARG